MNSPRGLRNCNPLNIRKTGSRPWLGEVRPGQDAQFCQFQDMAHGYRAAMRLLQNYQRLYGPRRVRTTRAVTSTPCVTSPSGTPNVRSSSSRRSR